MRFRLLFPAILLVALGIVIGCNSNDSRHAAAAAPNQASPQQVQTTYADGARRVTIVELQDLIKKNEAFIVDVRNQASFDSGHIPGAKLIPSTEIVNHLNELPKNKLIVTYCS